MRELVSREVWNPTSEKLDFEKKKRVASSKGERGSRHEGGITTRLNPFHNGKNGIVILRQIAGTK